MKVNTRIYIESNPYLKKYLKEHSYWYKYLNRDESLIKEMEQEMQKQYKLTMEDRMERVANSLNLVSNIMDIFK